MTGSAAARLTPRRVVAVLQARMGSTRLPGKTLADVGGVPMLQRLLSQLKGCRTLDDVVVATTVNAFDDQLAAMLARLGVRVVRGDVDDVLGRYVLAAGATSADVIVRLTGDCPLHAPDTIDDVVDAFLRGDVDYVTNTNPYTRPDGQDVEVFSRAALDQANRAAASGPDREHVTPWIRRAPNLRSANVTHNGANGAAWRWTVDDPADLRFVREVWQKLDERGPGPFSYEEIMSAVLESGARQGGTIPNEGYYKSLYDAASSERASALRLDKSEAWLQRSQKVIPGGAQTYSKSWMQHIRGVSPIFLERGQGARVWDVDGNEYVDLIQGLLPNILGYAHPEVDSAAAEQARRGHSFSLAHPLEVELAERLTKIIPCAEMVRFGKNGSDATAGAVRVARAFTGHDHVATCGYHGWQDWFIGTTSRHAGVPQTVCDLAHPFPYNDLEALDRLLASRPGEFAAVIMEPVNFFWPKEGYLAGVKEIAHRHGALLIFDEICTGFHFGLGGAQKIFGVLPDLAAFGKAMGNGYAISCVVGRRDVMRTFEDAFVSFTFAGDASCMAAALKVLDILEQGDAYQRIATAGNKLRDGTLALAKAAGLGDRFSATGHPHWPLLRFSDASGKDDPAMKSLWLQETVRSGVLVLATHNISAALDEATVHTVLSAYAHAFKVLAHAAKKANGFESWLDGPIPSPAFRARG